MERILELRVVAAVDSEEHATQRARFAASYDSSWREWLERFRRGEAIVARLKTSARFVSDGREGEVEVVNDGVWLEIDEHVPKVQEQIREIAYKDTRELEARLWREGVHVSARELEEMFFAVRLADDLEAALLARTAESPGASAPRADAARASAGRADA